MNTESLGDVATWLKVGIKAMFPFDDDTIATLTDCYTHLRSCRTGDKSKNELREKLRVTKGRLQSRLDLFKIKIDGEQLIIDRFTVTKAEWEGEIGRWPENIHDHAERIEGWLVEVAVPIPGGRDEPDDVDLAEVGKYASASEAAHEIIKALWLNHLQHAFEAEAQAQEFRDFESEAGEVF